MWNTRLILLSIFFCLWAFNLDFVIASEPADWGDVVDVNYSLWLDEEHTIEKTGNININLRYIYLRRSQVEQVPTKVYRAFPADSYEALRKVYLQAFIDEIIGMEVDGMKDFMIPAEDAYGDEDLYYRLKLIVILYDASEQTSEERNTSDPFKDFYPLLIGGSVVVLVGGFTLWRLQSARTQKSALSEEKTSSTVRAKSIQKDRDRLKELREITDSIAGSKDIAEKEEVKFRPRRR